MKYNPDAVVQSCRNIMAMADSETKSQLIEIAFRRAETLCQEGRITQEILDLCRIILQKPPDFLGGVILSRNRGNSPH